MNTNPEVAVEDKREDIIDGRRIVDINYFLNKIFDISFIHSGQCTRQRLQINSESKHGLHSVVEIGCNMCSKKFYVGTTENREDINKSAVYGTMATGSTYAHLEEFLGAMDVPSLSKRKYLDISNQLSNVSANNLIT